MCRISQKQFTEFMADALPVMMSAILREDDSAISAGHLSLPQFWALHYINEAGSLTANELAQKMSRSKSSISGLLCRLCHSGLIQRKRSTKDRRVIHITLKPKGKRVIEQIIENRKRGIANTYGVLDAAERANYKRMMEKIIRQSLTLLFCLAALIPNTFADSVRNTKNPESAPDSTSCSSCLRGDKNCAVHPRVYSLHESIQIGLDRSLNASIAEQQRSIAATRRKAALAGALPSLNGFADYTLYDADNITESGSKTIGAEASWTIFAGGRTLSAIRAAKTYDELTVWQERAVRETHAREIALAYHFIQLENAQVDVREQSIKQLSEFEAETRQKHQSGTLSEFEWLSAKVSLANEKPRLIEAKNDLELARERFLTLTGIEQAHFELSDALSFKPFDLSMEEAIRIGLKNRPELREAREQVALLQENVHQKKSDYYPEVDLFANYTYQNPDPYAFASFFSGGGADDDEWVDHWSAGIRASWKLFDGGGRRAELSESRLNASIAEDTYNQQRLDTTLEIRTQWLRCRDAAEALDATKESIELAERALTIARSRFDAQLGTRLEVTQANLELSEARFAHLTALHEHVAAVTRLKHATGTLLEEYEDE